MEPDLPLPDFDAFPPSSADSSFLNSPVSVASSSPDSDDETDDSSAEVTPISIVSSLSERFSVHPDLHTIRKIHRKLTKICKQTGVEIAPIQSDEKDSPPRPVLSSPLAVPSNLDEVEDTLTRLREHLEAYKRSFRARSRFERSLRARQRDLTLRQRKLTVALRMVTFGRPDPENEEGSGSKFERHSLDTEIVEDVKILKKMRRREPSADLSDSPIPSRHSASDPTASSPGSSDRASLEALRTGSTRKRTDSGFRPRGRSAMRRKKKHGDDERPEPRPMTLSGTDRQSMLRMKQIQDKRTDLEKQIQRAGEILLEYSICSNAIRACEVMLAQNEDKLPLLRQLRARDHPDHPDHIDSIHSEVSALDSSLSTLKQRANEQSEALRALANEVVSNWVCTHPDHDAHDDADADNESVEEEEEEGECGGSEDELEGMRKRKRSDYCDCDDDDVVDLMKKEIDELKSEVEGLRGRGDFMKNVLIGAVIVVMILVIVVLIK